MLATNIAAVEEDIVNAPTAVQPPPQVRVEYSNVEDFLVDYTSNQTIGGMFIARVNMNLREDKGWTYGARSWHYPSFVTGRWTLSSNVITEHTAEAIAEIRREIRNAQEDSPIKQQELTKSVPLGTSGRTPREVTL